MSEKPIRIAFFTDAYLEVDGVANTARQYEAYARRTRMPFMLLHGGYEKEIVFREGEFTRVELPRSRFGFGVRAGRDHEDWDCRLPSA